MRMDPRRTLALVWQTLIAYEELAVIALLALSAAVLALAHAPLALRLPYALLAVLLLPGLALSAFAFPYRRDLTPAERLALSLALSLALMAIAAPALDRSPWGLSARAVICALTLLTVGLTAASAWRRSRLPAGLRFTLFPERGWLAIDAATRRALGALALALSVSAIALGAMIASSPAPGTEFYLLGTTGLAEAYPRSARTGEAMIVTAGVVNREARAASFVATIVDQEDEATPLGQTPMIELASGAHWVGQLTFVPRTAGKDRQILFYLKRAGDAAPYRELRLWLDVAA